MPSYTAPVKDMMFLYEKLRDNKNYNELEKYKDRVKLKDLSTLAKKQLALEEWN